MGKYYTPRGRLIPMRGYASFMVGKQANPLELEGELFNRKCSWLGINGNRTL